MPTLQELMAEKNRRSQAAANQDGSSTPISLEALLAEKARRSKEGGGYAPRAAGLTGRTLVQGGYGAITSLPAMVADAYGGLTNLAAQYVVNPALDVIQEQTGVNLQRARGYKPFSALSSTAQAGQDIATGLGLAQAETPGEQMFVKGGTALIEAVGLGGAGRKIGTTFGKALAEAPIVSPLAAASGATAAEYGRQKGATPGQQIALGLLGAAAPATLAAAVPAGQAAIRGAVRGSQSGAMARNIAEMEAANIPVSVGTTAPTARAAMAESFLANTPTGRSAILKQRDAEAASIGSQIEAITKKLAPSGAGPIEAGSAITKGITQNYLPKARQLSDKLYARVDAAIPKDTRIPMPNFLRTIKEMTTPVRGAEKTSQTLMNPYIRELAANLSKDVGAEIGNISSIRPTYELISGLRSQIGRRLADENLISDIPRAELKRLYKALMDDMRDGLSNDPAALKELQRANGFTSSLHNKVDSILQPLVNKKAPEIAFNAVMANTADAGTVLKTVMGSLPAAERRIVASTIINRLGKARASSQGFDGGEFNAGTFLTNWNKLSPIAKNEVVKQFTPEMRRSFDTLGAATERIRNVNAAMPNPSGTAIVQSSFDTMYRVSAPFVAGAAGYGIGGASGAASALAAGVGIPFVTSKMMTNPKFVNWLAQQTKLPSSAVSGQIALLSAMNRKEGNEDLKQDIDRFIESVSQR